MYIFLWICFIVIRDSNGRLRDCVTPVCLVVTFPWISLFRGLFFLSVYSCYHQGVPGMGVHP